MRIPFLCVGFNGQGSSLCKSSEILLLFVVAIFPHSSFRALPDPAYQDTRTPFIIGSEVDVSCVLFLDHGAGWIKTKTHETSTSEPMINGVEPYEAI